MSQHKFHSRALRQLAEDLVQRIGEEYPLREDEQRDLATSLVRQWITYDGHATLFVGGQQVYLILGKTPLGRPRIVPETELLDWEHQLTERWHIAAQDLPGVFAQLNRGQSAEVTNAEGVLLRLWVYPREKTSRH
jgi:hypothetical protein